METCLLSTVDLHLVRVALGGGEHVDSMNPSAGIIQRSSSGRIISERQTDTSLRGGVAPQLRYGLPTIEHRLMLRIGSYLDHV